MFKALKVPKSLVPTLLIDSHNLQGHAGIVKIYFLIKNTSLGKAWQRHQKFLQNAIPQSNTSYKNRQTVMST